MKAILVAMSTPESPQPTFYELFKQAKNLNHSLNYLEPTHPELAQEIRTDLVKTEEPDESQTITLLFSDIRHQLHSQLANSTTLEEDPQVTHRLEHLTHLVSRFEKLFRASSPEWRRGVVYGILKTFTDKVA